MISIPLVRDYGHQVLHSVFNANQLAVALNLERLSNCYRVNELVNVMDNGPSPPKL